MIANQAYNRYSYMIPDIRKVQGQLEDRFEHNQASTEQRAQELLKASKSQAVEYLTNYSIAESQTYMKAYQDLAKYLFVKYLDGNIKHEKDGKFEYNPYGMPVQPTFRGLHPGLLQHRGTWQRRPPEGDRAREVTIKP